MLRNTTGGIQQKIAVGHLLFTVSLRILHNPRTFHIRVLILLTSLTLAHDGTAKGFLRHIQTSQFTTIRYHVAVELQVVALRVTPHEPCLTIVVNHHRRVDMIPGTVLEERFTDGITERTRGRVADSHTDSHATRQFGMGTDIPVELAVALDGLRGPCTVVSPREALQGQR